MILLIIVTIRQLHKYCVYFYCFLLQMVDADVFLTNPSTLSELVSKDLPIAAPMLVSDGLYSNFWLESWSHLCMPQHVCCSTKVLF